MSDALPVYEKLGAFYLGKSYDLPSQSLTDELVLYDSKDLMTHAVIVGMTGSGKTGLGIGLLEEAAMDGIPALIIDPKGDLSNLLLNFPELRARDFAPWVHADDAQRLGITNEEHAEQTAASWRDGLADWQQDGNRVARLRDAAQFRVYTPGSDSGLPVSIVASFAAPSAQVLEDGDLFRDRISTTANSLLGLLGIDADPLRSREHILITTILDTAWRQGQDLDLGALIHHVQSPSFDKVGVMDLDSFYSSKDRFELAMALNNLLAAPSFSTWLQGVPLDVDRLLYSPTGKPCLSIFSISHLSDSERMFFVSLLLNETLGWMRGCAGTTSLRALLYIDEIFGYMPPVSEPPSKKPLLTLLKQARAFGLGVVLSTQNPVDLDYKGLSNAGTWFLGRLQTERDQDRVLDGLQGATAESGEQLDRAGISEILANVGKRVFLMHNVHEDTPVLFQTRWTLSYLAGPLTRNQIRSLSDSQPDETLPEAAEAKTPERRGKAPDKASPRRPVLPPEIPQVYLASSPSVDSESVLYVPQLIASSRVHFVDSRRDLSAVQDLTLLIDVDDDAIDVDWRGARTCTLAVEELPRQPSTDGRYAPLPSLLAKSKNFSQLEKSLADHLYRTRRFDLFRCKTLKEYARPDESERAFRIRLTQRAREERDRQIDNLRERYGARIRTLHERVDRAEDAVEREQSQAQEAQMQSMISLGSSILGAVFGRKKLSSTNVSRASRTARGFGRASKQAQDVRRAEQKLTGYRDQLAELEGDLQADIEGLREDYDPQQIQLDSIQLKPRRTDIDIRTLAVAWIPATSAGELTSLDDPH